MATVELPAFVTRIFVKEDESFSLTVRKGISVLAPSKYKDKYQIRKVLDLLVHVPQCRIRTCQYYYCPKIKGLFYRGMHCETRAPGGCNLCQKMWYFLKLHARYCKVSICHVPRCRELKNRQMETAAVGF